VDAPHRASAGSSISPMVSLAMRMSAMMSGPSSVG
jgi:hypothetical protein